MPLVVQLVVEVLAVGQRLQKYLQMISGGIYQTYLPPYGMDLRTILDYGFTSHVLIIRLSASLILSPRLTLQLSAPFLSTGTNLWFQFTINCLYGDTTQELISMKNEKSRVPLLRDIQEVTLEGLLQWGILANLLSDLYWINSRAWL